jgi:hypothetical protein
MKDGQGMLAHLAEFIWIAQLSSATRRPQKQINNSNQSSRGKTAPSSWNSFVEAPSEKIELWFFRLARWGLFDLGHEILDLGEEAAGTKAEFPAEEMPRAGPGEVQADPGAGHRYIEKPALLFDPLPAAGAVFPTGFSAIFFAFPAFSVAGPGAAMPLEEREGQQPSSRPATKT